MCGFVGVFSKKLLKKNHINSLNKMNKIISHRGPDSKGLYCVKNYAAAFSRLSIIDVNKRSDQPFNSKDKRYSLVYNGEIYNFKKLKSELEIKGIKFFTKSDTEVVLQSFIEWGTNCVKKFNGMFTFVIYDKKEKKLSLFRDHLGIKPLYYLKFDNQFYFASEMKAFKEIIPLKLNFNKLVEYMTWGSILGSETLFKEIKQLEPGHFLEINKNFKIKKNMFFNLKNTFSNSSKSFNINSIDKELRDSIKSHTVSDVGYGTQLSGGIDSSFITSIASTSSNKMQNEQLKTFSTNLENKKMDEKKYQKIISKKYKTKHYAKLFKQSDAKKNLEKSIWFYDYPLHHPNIISSYLMNSLARKKNTKVLLSGDGADELFLGYAWDLFKTKKTRKNIVNSNSYLPYKITSNLFNFSNNAQDSRKKLIKGIKNKNIAQSLLNQKGFLDKWLQRQDRSGMFASVEIRVPFCNVELFKKINSINFEKKTKNGSSAKFLLKKISEKYLPKSIIYRKKIGFSLPLEDWFRDKNGFGSLLKYLKDDKFKSRSFYNHKFINELINNHLKKKYDNGRVLWMLINLELWQRIFIDQTIKIKT